MIYLHSCARANLDIAPVSVNRGNRHHISMYIGVEKKQHNKNHMPRVLSAATVVRTSRRDERYDYVTAGVLRCSYATAKNYAMFQRKVCVRNCEDALCARAFTSE